VGGNHNAQAWRYVDEHSGDPLDDTDRNNRIRDAFPTR
jgi:hypothetical protein